MVADDKLHQPSPKGPLTFTPSVAGSFFWKDRQSVVFHPTAALKRSTSYQVKIASDVRALDGATLADGGDFGFTTPRLEITEVLAGDRAFLPVKPTVTLRFSQPVAASDVASKCVFAADGGASIDARLLDGEESGPTSSVALEPKSPLARATAYHLTCDASLHGAEGPAGMAQAYTEALHTYGDLKVVTATPSGGVVSADEQEILIELSNPVMLHDVSRHLTSEPKIASLTEGWVEDGRKYHVRVNLEPGTFYTVRLSAGVRDQFGQELKKEGEYSFSFTAGDAKPRLSMEAGTFAVEASWPRYSIWTRNLTHVDVQAARVPEDKLSAVLSSGVREWGEEGEEATDGSATVKGWKKAGLKVRRQRVDLQAPKNKWQAGMLELAALADGAAASATKNATGVFALLVQAPEQERAPRGILIANVTNLGLVAKLGVSSGLVWAVHLSDGKPAPNVKITIRDGTNKARWSGTTGADGTVETPGASSFAAPASKLRDDEEYGEERAGGALLVTAHEGNDLAVLSGDWNEGVSTWNFQVPRASPQTARIRGFIHTDRGLYRPGETVHVKGLARLIHLGEGMKPPTEKSIELQILDPHGDEIVKKNVAVSAFGGFSLDVALDGEARLGDWDVVAHLGSGAQAATFRDHFSVEEYRPATFEVKLKAKKPSYVIGDRVRTDAEGLYLYGAPLGGGHVAWKVRRRDHVPDFPAFEGFTFADLNAADESGHYWMRYGERSYSYDVTEEEGELDGKGRASLRFSTSDPDKQLKTSQDYLIEASVTDASNQTMTASTSVVAHRSPFYLGLKASELVPSAEKPFTVRAVAVDTDGKPRAADAELVVTLRSWKCDWAASSTGSYYGSYHCEAQSTDLERRKLSLTATGAIEVPVTTHRAGTIYLSLHAADGKGNEVIASDEVWATGRGEASWRMSEDATFPLIANQPRYQPGDTARLVAQAPFDGATALITVERDGIISHEVRPFASSGESIDVALKDAFAPNVFASVVLVRGRTGEGEQKRPAFRMGVANLLVDAAQKKLLVKVSTDKPAYRPGDEVKARVQVNGADGAPVVSEVALAVADEGVLQLINYQTPDPAAAFYAVFGLGVETSTTWTKIAKRTDPNESDEGEGGDSGESSGKPRSKFLATAFWAPALVTGSDGSAEVSFKAPDNLTAFRVMAVAADLGDRFGSGAVRMQVRKPLSAVPALPRFLTVGDRAQAGVVVHNDTGAAGTVTVAAEAEGATLSGETRKDVSLAAGASKAVLFDLHAPKTGAAKLTFRAALGDEKDAVEAKLPVERPSESDAVVVGEGDTSGLVTLAVAVPKDAIADVGGLEVTLDPSGMAGVEEGLRYLIEYPYGCLEQTTSRVIPMVQVEDLAKSLDLPGLRGPQLRGFVEAGIAKILRHQHEDGAFSLWPSSQTEPFLTAFGLWGLHVAQSAGYNVDAKAIARGVDALKLGVNEKDMGHSDNPLGEEGSRAFALFVLAELGRPDPGAMAKLFDARASLPVFGEALLARALRKASGDPKMIDALVEDVVKHAEKQGDGGMRISDPKQQDLWWYFSSDTRTTALALSMLLEVAPEHPLVPQLAKGLLASRTDGRWENTQDNLFSLVALDQYAYLKRTVASASRVVVELDGKKLLDTKVPTGRHPVKRARVPMRALADGKLTITPTGGTIGYSARVRFARSLEHAKADAVGFSLERWLEDPATGAERSTVKTGDIVRVKLRIHVPEERVHVALVDRLPAGLEPINPRLIHASDEEASDRDRWRWEAIELHDDRVAVFAERLWPHSEHTFEYLARATTEGKFMLPGATVEEMYRPEHHARTETRALEVKAK
jgi:uncharacterized protein YfaS (alpha-2-macroglobulin family)